MLVSQVMVTDTVQWFWDPAIEWSQCLEERTITLEFDLCFVFAQTVHLPVTYCDQYRTHDHWVLYVPPSQP